MNSIPFVTNGLDPGSAGFTSLVTGGVPASPNPPVPPPTPQESTYPLSSIVLPTGSSYTALDLAALQSPSIIRDASGRTVAANPLASIDLGNGTVLDFDPSTLDARMTPALDPTAGGSSNYLYDNIGDATFTASDCRIMIELPQTPSSNGAAPSAVVAKQLLEATTLTVSVHRAKNPVRCFGYINPTGFSRGSRTIAGTLVLSSFTAEVLYRFLQAGLVSDLSKDTNYTKLDQLPPFTFTLLFNNEQGYASSQRLIGVEFITAGAVNSIQDMILEQTITYMAMDMTPLTPLNFSTFFSLNTKATPATAAQKTVQSLWGKA
jgi:hypothetical protein